MHSYVQQTMRNKSWNKACTIIEIAVEFDVFAATLSRALNDHQDVRKGGTKILTLLDFKTGSYPRPGITHREFVDVQLFRSMST